MVASCIPFCESSFPPSSLDGVEEFMKATRGNDESSHPLEYATPERVPLGRCFLRRAIIFIAVLGSIFAMLEVLGVVADHYRWFDFMAQK